MLAGTALDTAVRHLPSRPLRGTFFRAIPLKYRNTPFGLPPVMNANRFNLPAGTPALYLGADVHVCVDEVQMDASPDPTVIFRIEVDLKAVADLRDPDVLAALALDADDVTFNFRSLGPAGRHSTQILGECCAQLACVDGLLYPSAAHAGGHALAVFEASLAALGGSLMVHGPSGRVKHRLP